MNSFEKYKQLIIKIVVPILALSILVFLIISGSSNGSEEQDTKTANSLSLFNEDELVATRYTDSVEEKLNYAVDAQDSLKDENQKMKDEIKALKDLILKEQKIEPSTSSAEKNLYNSFPTMSNNFNENKTHTTEEKPKIIYKVMEQSTNINSIDSNFGKENQNKTKKQKNSDEKKLYLPTTAVTTGTLLHGINAPTSMSHPMPTVVMIRDIAFLPNRKELNIKECNVLVEGYGQLSDERAYFKFAKFVCISKDGEKVYDTKASGYITSLVDNKQGLPGHVVSKQNEMLKRMFLAGIFEGAAEMFKDSGASTITSALGTTTTQSTSSNDKAKNILGGGLSTASESAKELYLEKAKNISETIEVLAQDVGLVFTDGLILEPLDLNKKGNEENENVN